MKSKFFRWLDETFNDFYLYEHDFSGDLLVIQHSPDTNHERMWDLLTKFHPAVFRETEAPNITVNTIGDKFVIEYGRALCGTITITPYDNYLYHTGQMEENNGRH